MAKLDWIASTVPEYPRVVADALASELPGANGLEPGRGRHGYTKSANIVSSSGDTIAQVLHGGSNTHPHIVGTGDNAPAVSEIIRKHWPDSHRPSRLDSCEDIYDDYPGVVARVEAIGDLFGMKARFFINRDPELGNTCYLGAPSSSVIFRIYEKGKQLRPSLSDPADYRPDHLRLETQYRPLKQARSIAAGLTPGEVWGVSSFTHEIARTILQRAPQRIKTRARLQTTLERRDAALERQYGRHLREKYFAAGSIEQFGADLALLIGVIDDV